MKIRIEDSLEITLEWNCNSSEKEAFLYLVAFKLASGKVNDVHDILFRDMKKEDGIEYLSVKKSTFLSSNTLTQTIKINVKKIRNAIEDIYFLLLSFKNDNIANGKIVLQSDGKKMEYKYEVSSSQHLCIEFGHLKRCSDYWELNLYTQEYKSIDIPYRTFATKNLKNEHPASDIFQLKEKIDISGGRSVVEIPIKESGDIPSVFNGGSCSKEKKGAGKNRPRMPASKIAANDKKFSGSMGNSQDADESFSKAEVVSVKSTATEKKKKRNKSSKGIMPNKKNKR